MARIAAVSSALATTMLIEHSEDPWAMAITLTPALPRAVKIRPETP